VDALVRANFDEIIDQDVKTARVLELAPYGAEAEVSGEGAEAFVDGLREYRVTIRPSSTGFIVRTRDLATLTAALRAAPRPLAKVRVAVQ
jgi:hypothetical protein